LTTRYCCKASKVPVPAAIWAAVPISTCVAAVRFVPVTVTEPPPLTVPLAGESEVIVGAEGKAWLVDVFVEPGSASDDDIRT
jgi:hypothetical protein